MFFTEADGTVPLLEWLDEQEAKVQDKCIVKIDRLQQSGFELRRPETDFLRNGIYELRVRHRNVNYRILYFFHERLAVVSQGLTKEDIVPEKEIEFALLHKSVFSQNPEKHTYKE